MNHGEDLRWLTDHGATYALPRGRTKGQFPKGWQNTPHTFQEASDHAKSGGNVGMLTGKHSGGIVAIDRDKDFPATVARLGEMANTAKIQRSNAPDRGKLLYRVKGKLPKSTSWKEQPTDEHPACELLSDGRHALVPPSEYNGGRYELVDHEQGIREVTPAELSGLWFLITGEFLDGERVQPDPLEGGDDARAYVRRVKDAWPTLAVFAHFGKDAHGTLEDRGEQRILGNGGMMVNDAGLWFCFADGIGGDNLDAWAWCKDGKVFDHGDKRAFWAVVNDMAAAAGIEQPKQAHQVHQNGGKGNESTEGEHPNFYEYIKGKLAAWGYADLWLSEMDEAVYLGQDRFTDANRAQLRMKARCDGFGGKNGASLSALDDAFVTYAAERRRHPGREYLGGRQWDGRDHIAALAAHFTDSHDRILYPDGSRRTVFHAVLRRWLVGAVAKQHEDQDAARKNFMLVLAGGQDAGKSYFAQWICPLPGCFVEGAIMPDSKDCSLKRTRSFVWEVGELGATTRRADVEALKAFITTTTVSERPAYGHFDLVRPAIVSYIGTVNPDGGGFLSDSTGNRRFAVVDLVKIDWAYSDKIDVHQVWAQAVHLWRADKGAYRFTPEESAVLAGNAEAHMEPDVFADAIARCFDIAPERTDWRVTSTELLDVIRTFGGISRGHDRQQGRDVARALLMHWGLTSKRSNGATVYAGLRRKDADWQPESAS